MDIFRVQKIYFNFQNKTVGVTLDLSSGIFTNKKHTLKQSFQDRTRKFYDVDVEPTDFRDLKASTEQINNYVAKATNNRIVDFISQSEYFQVFSLFTTEKIFVL